MLVSFELTMPNKGSWSGKWTGEENKYFVIKTISERYLKGKGWAKTLLDKGIDNFHYSWGDGWGANVTVQRIDAAQARQRRKLSKGFCGYEWMIDSIMWYGDIKNSTERKSLLEL